MAESSALLPPPVQAQKGAASLINVSACASRKGAHSIFPLFSSLETGKCNDSNSLARARLRQGAELAVPGGGAEPFQVRGGGGAGHASLKTEWFHPKRPEGHVVKLSLIHI